MSIVSQAGQLVHTAGDSFKHAIKQAVPSWLKSVGHVLGGDSGRPIKPANPIMPVNVAPGISVP